MSDIHGHVIVRIGIPMPHYPWKTYEKSLTYEELREIVDKYGLEDVSDRDRYETSATFVKIDGEFKRV